MIAFTSCKKDDGAIPKRIGIEDIPAITTNIEAGSTNTITFTNQAAFQGKFTVSLYFPGTPAPAKVDIVVRKNGAAASVKVFKAGVATFPSAVTVTAAEIATLFGTAIALNDTYDFAPDIYVGTKKYEAFPLTGLGSGAGVVNMPGYGEYVRYTAK
ncbi:MAG TPA: hypothetical protein DHW64_02930 [Chitinophagaceae bacterium]|nr:hypothetical protein [Chitinophagaceae bacterium]